ncbi:SDR family oxidoreductase [Dactylosporangium roseum]|uniref:SDR family oxidoreductase n=1 Tax=Dactylosporangium roseum TaxID=47989 RepID=A0ABY5Z3P4_9ACTN|nr:SDR family oxidoreductase [Dactylosporangium roseum]UWZ36437.1 SDR family oxidoreductase [Dactylosporangium roseum]
MGPGSAGVRVCVSNYRTRRRHIIDSIPDSYTDVIPLGRPLDAGEITAPIAFLASAANTGITGQVVAIDGGV